MGNSELFTKNRMWAFTTISIMCGDFEYEGQPDLKGIEDVILELIGGEMIYATVPTHAAVAARLSRSTSILPPCWTKIASTPGKSP